MGEQAGHPDWCWPYISNSGMKTQKASVTLVVCLAGIFFTLTALL